MRSSVRVICLRQMSISDSFHDPQRGTLAKSLANPRSHIAVEREGYANVGWLRTVLDTSRPFGMATRIVSGRLEFVMRTTIAPEGRLPLSIVRCSCVALVAAALTIIIIDMKAINLRVDTDAEMGHRRMATHQEPPSSNESDISSGMLPETSDFKLSIPNPDGSALVGWPSIAPASADSD